MKKFIISLFLVPLLLSGYGCGGDKKTDNNAPQPAGGRPEISKVMANGSTSSNAPASGAVKKSRPADAQKAPDFSLTTIDGKTMRISDYKGKVVILDFWATWCPPCRAEIPFFIELMKQYNKEELQVLGIALDDINRVKNFYKQNGMDYPVAIADTNTPIAYGGIQGIPTTFVIDKEGYITQRYVGYRPKQVFEQDYLSLK
jgi:peroxiredoxin